jgi:hypothetical protein
MIPASAMPQRYVEHCNNVCLNTAIGYITPKDMLTGQQEIHEDRTLEAASNNSRFVDRPCEKAKTPFSGRFRVTDEVDYFQMADGSEVLLGHGVESGDHASTQSSHPTRPSRRPDLCRQ